MTPNILFILTDQQSSRAMGAYGNRYMRTPYMDALAARGVRFEQSYCTSPVCSPARASLLTGRMPSEVGVDYITLGIPTGIPSLGSVFREAGYETAWTGKWHLPAGYALAPDAIPDFTNLAIPPEQGRYLGTCVDERVAEAAVDFLHQQHDRPFLLCVSLHNPHDICHWIMEAHEGFLDQFRPEAGQELPPLPANFDVLPDEPEFIAWCRQRDHYGAELQWTHDWTEQMWRTYLYVYARLVEHADAQVGRVLQALQETGQERETLVVFTSDHGEGMAAHHWVVKLMLYEEPVTVPLVLSWPGVIPAGQVDRTHLASGLDLMRTMCDYAGVAPPADARGRSLRPLVENPSQPEEGFVVAELQPDTERPELKARMVRTPRYKYIVCSHGLRPELLFDLAADPGETANLAADPGHVAVRDHHRALLRRWMAEIDDPFVMPNLPA